MPIIHPNPIFYFPEILEPIENTIKTNKINIGIMNVCSVRYSNYILRIFLKSTSIIPNIRYFTIF